MSRILTITSWYPPHHYGGYELSCFDVMSRLGARGHEVRVLCGSERIPDPIHVGVSHEAFVYRELRPHLWEATTERPGLRERVAIERHNRRVLERHLAEFQPDVVSVWHMVAISMSLVRHVVETGTPLVYVVCDNWLLYGERQDAWMSPFNQGLGGRVTGRMVEASTGLFTSTGDLGDTGTFCFVSDHIRRRAQEKEPWSFPLSTVVYSGIDGGLFRQMDAAPKRSWSGHLLYVGRLDARKGVDTLLQALALLPTETTLSCFGRGAEGERARLRCLAERLGLSDRVTFGSLERDELASRYHSADALVFPSEWDEPFGLVPLEAMACGTPVVATGVGGSGEFLQDGYNCVQFSAGDPEGLAAAVRTLASDAELRDELVRGGRRTAEQLDVDKLADFLELWHMATAERFHQGHPPDRTLDLPRPRASGHERGNNSQVIPGAEHLPRANCDRLVGRILSFDGFGRASDGRMAISATERARPAAGNRPATPAHVVAELEQLPFRTGAFDGLCCEGAIERARDGAAFMNELGRVLRAGGVGIFASSVRGDAAIARSRIRDRLAGLRRPQRAYFHSPANVREYSPNELMRLLEQDFQVRSRSVIGWSGSWKGRIATALCQLSPLRQFARGIVLETERASGCALRGQRTRDARPHERYRGDRFSS